MTIVLNIFLVIIIKYFVSL